MVYSIIQKSALEGSHRLDAEYFQPQYLKIVQTLTKSNKSQKWSEIEGKFITGPFGSEFNVENYSDEREYRYIRGKDVKQFFLEDNDNVYIPKKDFERLKKYSLSTGDILISVVGTNGNTVVIDKSVPPAIFSCKSTAFRTKAIDPFYFIAFLNSKYGQQQLERSVRGALQTGLNIDDLKSILVFSPGDNDQKSMGELVEKAKNEYENSKELYSQAQSLLLEELGPQDNTIHDDLSFVVKLSDMLKAHRIDAEYFQPKYDRIIERVKKHKNGQLDELVDSLGHATQPKYVEHGEVAVLAQKHMNTQLSIDVKSFDNFTNLANIPAKERTYILKRGDVMISSVGDPGLTCVWNEEYEEKVIPGSYVTLIRTKKSLNPFYLGVVLNSLVGKMQFRKYQAASVQQYVYPKDMKKLFIPLLPTTIQERIEGLVLESHAARKKSKELLEEAKRKVEEMIEESSK